MTALITQDFSGSDVSPLPAPWTTVTGEGSVDRVSSQAKANAAANRNAAYYDQAIPNDQYAQCNVVSVDGTGVFVGPMVRVQTGAESFYAGGPDRIGSGATIRIWGRNAGTFFSVQSGTATSVANDLWRLEVKGNALELFQNGGSVLIGTDNTFSSGRAGICLETLSATNSIVDNFEAGTFSTAGFKLILTQP